MYDCVYTQPSSTTDFDNKHTSEYVCACVCDLVLAGVEDLEMRKLEDICGQYSDAVVGNVEVCEGGQVADIPGNFPAQH